MKKTYTIFMIFTLIGHSAVILPMDAYSSSDEEAAGIECAICFHRKGANQFRKLPNCAHRFCVACLDNLPRAGHHECPECRRPWTPEELANQPVEQRECSLCFDDKPVDEFRELTCGHNGVCVDCLREEVNQALDAADVQEDLRQHLRCTGCRGAVARDRNAIPPLMQPGDIRMIYDGDQERVDRFHEVVRVLDLRQENIQNEAALNRFLAENQNARRCPTAGCQWAYLIEANQRPENVQCDVCRQQYCSHCRVAHRVGDPCRRLQPVVANNNNAAPNSPEERARLEQERANLEWARQNIKACPACRRNVNRIGGCNYMRCDRREGGCGHEFCWMCLVPDPGHMHVRCLPEDLARARELYGDGAGVPSTSHDIYGLNRPAEPIQPVMPPPVRANIYANYNFGIPAAPAAAAPYVPLRQNNYNYDYQPAPQPAFHRNDGNGGSGIRPFFYVMGACAVIGVCSYKLYQYLIAPKPVEIPDLKTNMESLHKEAIKARNQLISANGYMHASFKNYFEVQVAQDVFKDLDEAKMKVLQKIVDDLEGGLVAGACDAQYNALVNFIIALDAKETSNQPSVVAVPAKEVAVKTVAPKVVKKQNRRQVHKKSHTKKVK